MLSASLDFKVPEDWHELSDKQLKYIFRLLAGNFSADTIKALCLIHWSFTEILGKNENGDYLLRQGHKIAAVSIESFAPLLSFMDWLCTTPPAPVRPSMLRRHKALAADFSDVPFESYIIVDNLYQGYLHTRQDSLLDELATVMYPGIKPPLDSWERIAVLYWVIALKDFFARKFPDFFSGSPETESGNLLGFNSQSPISGSRIEDAMNAQIRALTKGDVTKESEILALDTWRALTELNAQAKEYKQLNEQLNKK